MNDRPHFDPYQLRPEYARNPPRGFVGTYRMIGPGLILAAGLVGSGELVATTVLGAENGYRLLWLVLVSCTIKTVVQNELGRYSIGTGETTLEAFNRVPGPRWRVSWVVWLWCVAVLFSLFGLAGMLGGIGEVLNRIVLAIAVGSWVWIVNFVTVALLLIGRYAVVEKVSVTLVLTFTALTVSCAALLLKRPDFFSWASVADGLSFRLPEAGFVTAVTVFGVTGVSAMSLVIYPYWCLEKGYARFTGTCDNSDQWQRRARGWIRVMGVDVVSAMVVYTAATVAFYVLGAGILRGMGIVPKGAQMVQSLSNVYTVILGGWSGYLFLIGAFAVLYSSVFAGTASQSRTLADFLGLLGVFDKRDYRARIGVTRIAVVFLLFLPSLYFMWFQEPVWMVKVGGVAQAMLLPVIGFSTIYLRYVHLPSAIRPATWISVTLWVASVVMLIMMVYSMAQELLG
jgi:Mn2+/Fe2+ NRAMP family transporter